MTSIEWLFNELWEAPKDKLTWHSILKKAKEMHKQEMATNCSQQEISDEEIEEGADKYYPCDELDYGLKGMIISAKKGAWFDAIKWYREQLKSK